VLPDPMQDSANVLWALAKPGPLAHAQQPHEQQQQQQQQQQPAPGCTLPLAAPVVHCLLSQALERPQVSLFTAPLTPR